MKKSLLATSVLLIIFILTIAITFGVGERYSIVTYSKNFEGFDGLNVSHRIDMYSPDALSLTPAKKITDSGYDLGVDLEDVSLSYDVSAKNSIEWLREDMLLTEDHVNKSGMPDYNLAPSSASAKNTSQNSEKVTALINSALQNSASGNGPRVNINLSLNSAWRYEPVVIKADVETGDTITDISMYVRTKKDLKARVNGDERYDINVFKTGANNYKGTYLHPFGGPIGQYQAVVVVGTKGGQYAYTTDFTMKGKTSPEAGITKKITTLEYSVDTANKKIPSLKGGEPENFDSAIYDWIRYMKCDIFWVLAGQTTGWDGGVKPETPFSAATIRNINNLAKNPNKKDVALGAYVMSYYAPGGGAKRGGYEPAIGYESSSRSLIESRHISLASKKREQDIINILKGFDNNPNVEYLGLDFIRTGERDGFEMVDEMVEMTGIATPPSWSTMSKAQRMLWLAQSRIAKKEVNIKWRWFRAQREAHIIKAIRQQVSKPLWAFTLGWNHGQEHGQDPYMFFDAGIDYDAIMIYEATRMQQLGMLISWPQYLGGEYNVLVGNMIDNRLQDGNIRPEMEYMRRMYEAEAKFNRSSRIRGVFFHDVSRMLWSKNRGAGNGIREWANINASIVSRVEEKYSENPLSLMVTLNENNNTGVVSIQNKTSTEQNVSLSADLAGGLSAIVFDTKNISIVGGGKVQVPFKYSYGGGRYSSLMSIRAKNSNGAENVFVVYTLLQSLKQTKETTPSSVVVANKSDSEVKKD